MDNYYSLAVIVVIAALIAIIYLCITTREWLRDALFLDIPYIVDSFCRNADYILNRRHRYSVEGSGVVGPTKRSPVALPAFAMFVLVLLFVAYGPTWSGLCGVLGQDRMAAWRIAAGYLCLGGAALQLALSSGYFWSRINKRFEKQKIESGRRKWAVRIVVLAVLYAWILPLWFFGKALLDDKGFEVCLVNAEAWPSWVQLVLFLLMVVVAALLTHHARTVRIRIAGQAALIILLVVVLWNLPTAITTEGAQVPYPHLYGVVAVGLAIVALLSNCLVYIPFGSLTFKERWVFRKALKARELFSWSRQDPVLSQRRILGGCVIGILREPLQFMLLPAFAVILVPTGFLWHAFLGGTAASALLITAANLTSRWDRMSEYLRRYFLIGTPLAVSIAVIAIAVMRLANVQYVTTVLNVAPFGVLFTWVCMTYVLFWWFEYHINNVLAAKLLEAFSASDGSDGAIVKYVPGRVFFPRSRIERTNRYLAAHGLGQFAVVGSFREQPSRKVQRAFNVLGFQELFAVLLVRKYADAASEMGRRIELYFALVNATLAIGFGILLWHHGLADRDNTIAPVVTARGGAVEGNTDLVPLLQGSSASRSPAIVVSASGGGTRAALYTANVLRGLHAIGADSNVVLLSGVSGGGVAAAYFYSHRAALLSDTPQRCAGVDDRIGSPWACFVERMTQPFIRDVLHGAFEWRVQSQVPLGVLLAESFERRVFVDGFKNIAGDGQIGLILNTTIAGHPQAESVMLRGAFLPQADPEQHACDAFVSPASSLGGGRLSFTNVSNVAAFAKTSARIQGIQLPFIVVQDGAVPLSIAAALNANFPPVFPNARVNIVDDATSTQVCRTRSYFVTDGGATENLGLISALLVLKSALTDARLRAPLRDVHIVLAEASAMDYDYSQDRGVGAATGGAKERLTGRLTLELLESVESAARAIDKNARIVVHDLSLPRVFRSRGGFGTHWMYPETVQIANPQIARLPYLWTQAIEQYSRMKRYWVTIDRRQMLELQDALFDPKLSFCEKQWPAERDRSKDFSTISSWICGRSEGKDPALVPDGQPAAWAEVVDSLRQSKSTVK